MRPQPGYPCSIDAEPATAIQLLALLRRLRELGYHDALIAGETFFVALGKAAKLEGLAEKEEYQKERQSAVHVHTVLQTAEAK